LEVVGQDSHEDSCLSLATAILDVDPDECDDVNQDENEDAACEHDVLFVVYAFLATLVGFLVVPFVSNLLAGVAEVAPVANLTL